VGHYGLDSSVLGGRALPAFSHVSDISKLAKLAAFCRAVSHGCEGMNGSLGLSVRGCHCSVY